MIEKNENDSLFSTKKECVSLEMTRVSMWITLWKLGISLPIWGGFHKIIGKMMWKSRYTYFGSCQNRPNGSKNRKTVEKSVNRNFCKKAELMVK